jgi:protein TonB
MRYALSGSALVHAAIFGTALIGFAWPQADDAPAPGAVTVDIVNVSSVSTNSTQTLVSSAPENLVSAGAEASPPVLKPITHQTLEKPPEIVQKPIEPEPVQPTADPLPPKEPERVEAQAAPSIEPAKPSAQTEILAAAMLQAEPADTIALTAAEPVRPMEQSAAIAAKSVTDARVAPVPQTLSFKRPSAPTAREPAQPRRETAQQQQPAPSRQKPPSQAGNGGQNQADAAAAPASAGQNGSVGGGGSADTASWERQVSRRLASALRYPRAANGERGEVVVRFTVASQGDASGMQVVRSSGNPVLDQAALETVSRAAPFPPIPAGAGFKSKTFDFPLGFVRN